MTQSALVDAYQSFMLTAAPYVNIIDEHSYHEALESLERLLECADDTVDDPMNPLIDMLGKAIEKYEAKDQSLLDFIAEAEDIPADIALLRTLMRQHRLTGGDLAEIGGKTMVSKVLNGQRKLSRNAIEQLAARFNISPGLFFAA